MLKIEKQPEPKNYQMAAHADRKKNEIVLSKTSIVAKILGVLIVLLDILFIYTELISGNWIEPLIMTFVLGYIFIFLFYQYRTRFLLKNIIYTILGISRT